MNTRSFYFITIANFIILLSLLAYLFFSHFEDVKTENIVYVDNIRLFNGFNMTKDLNRLNQKVIKGQKKKLDSLYTIYQIYKQNDKEDLFAPLEDALRKEDQKLKIMNDNFNNEVSEKVWLRLNNYIKDFGTMKEYKIILGTQGNGNVMYANEGTDITNELINYVNSNYEGE